MGHPVRIWHVLPRRRQMELYTGQQIGSEDLVLSLTFTGQCRNGIIDVKWRRSKVPSSFKEYVTWKVTCSAWKRLRLSILYNLCIRSLHKMLHKTRLAESFQDITTEHECLVRSKITWCGLVRVPPVWSDFTTQQNLAAPKSLENGTFLSVLTVKCDKEGDLGTAHNVRNQPSSRKRRDMAFRKAPRCHLM